MGARGILWRAQVTGITTAPKELVWSELIRHHTEGAIRFQRYKAGAKDARSVLDAHVLTLFAHFFQVLAESHQRPPAQQITPA